MNRKILGAAVGSLAIAGIVGGTTFASWSDQTSISASAGAETLEMALNDAGTGTAATDWTNLELAPGTELETDYYVVSRSGDHTYTDLKLTLADLIGTENGCNGAFEDSDQIAAFTESCDVGNGLYDSEGQFADHAKMVVRVTDVLPEAAACNSAGGYTHTPFDMKLADAHTVQKSLLRDVNNNSVLDNDEKLGPDEKVCVNVQVRMPFSVDNSSQGDSATFNLVWDLEQVGGNP